MDYYDFREPRPAVTDNQVMIDALAKNMKVNPTPQDGYVRFPGVGKVALSEREWKGITRSGHPFRYSADNDSVPMKAEVHESLDPCVVTLAGDDLSSAPNMCEDFGRKRVGTPDGATWYIYCKKVDQRLCWAESTRLRVTIVVDAAGLRAVCYPDGAQSQLPISMRLDQRQWIIREALFAPKEFGTAACLTGQDAAEFVESMHDGAELEAKPLNAGAGDHNEGVTVDLVYADAMRLARYLASRNLRQGEKEP